MSPPCILVLGSSALKRGQLACGTRFYATTTFQMVGMGVTASLASSAITNTVNLVATIIAIALVNRYACWCTVRDRGQAVHGQHGQRASTSSAREGFRDLPRVPLVSKGCQGLSRVSQGTWGSRVLHLFPRV